MNDIYSQIDCELPNLKFDDQISAQVRHQTWSYVFQQLRGLYFTTDLGVASLTRFSIRESVANWPDPK